MKITILYFNSVHFETVQNITYINSNNKFNLMGFKIIQFSQLAVFVYLKNHLTLSGTCVTILL